jgi:plasmid maintenance system antidote protein VapI
VKQRYRTLADYFEQTERPQVELALELGVSKAFISMLVKGQRKASPALAMRITELTGVNLASMVDPKLAALLVRAS